MSKSNIPTRSGRCSAVRRIASRQASSLVEQNNAISCRNIKYEYVVHTSHRALAHTSLTTGYSNHLLNIWNWSLFYGRTGPPGHFWGRTWTSRDTLQVSGMIEGGGG